MCIMCICVYVRVCMCCGGGRKNSRDDTWKSRRSTKSTMPEFSALVSRNCLTSITVLSVGVTIICCAACKKILLESHQLTTSATHYNTHQPSCGEPARKRGRTRGDTTLLGFFAACCVLLAAGARLLIVTRMFEHCSIEFDANRRVREHAREHERFGDERPFGAERQTHGERPLQ